MNLENLVKELFLEHRWKAIITQRKINNILLYESVISSELFFLSPEESLYLEKGYKYDFRQIPAPEKIDFESFISSLPKDTFLVTFRHLLKPSESHFQNPIIFKKNSEVIVKKHELLVSKLMFVSHRLRIWDYPKFNIKEGEEWFCRIHYLGDLEDSLLRYLTQLIHIDLKNKYQKKVKVSTIRKMLNKINEERKHAYKSRS
jgi:hypothetical protein